MRSPGPQPLTADERERRVIQYLLTLHKGDIAHFRLTRLNRVANFRRQLMQLLEEMIESRAEVIAAGMVMEYAPERPERIVRKEDVAEGRLPLPERKRRRPKWLPRDPAPRKRTGELFTK